MRDGDGICWFLNVFSTSQTLYTVQWTCWVLFKWKVCSPLALFVSSDCAVCVGVLWVLAYTTHLHAVSSQSRIARVQCNNTVWQHAHLGTIQNPHLTMFLDSERKPQKIHAWGEHADTTQKSPRQDLNKSLWERLAHKLSLNKPFWINFIIYCI